tara:strand:+ start:307 stop:723 length:417 start_codon:yes stop_codon:yes gene_type:complete
MSILTNEEIVNINRKYGEKNTDNHMQKIYDNLEKTSTWISVKNNNKTNKFKKKIYTKNYKTDPYKFLKIPVNIREIILNLCLKNNITLQILVVKTNLRLSLIDNYINNNYCIDNYYLDIILKYLNFDLLDYINKQHNK